MDRVKPKTSNTSRAVVVAACAAAVVSVAVAYKATHGPGANEPSSRPETIQTLGVMYPGGSGMR